MSRPCLLSLLITLALATGGRPALAVSPVPVDKVAHFGVSYVLTDQLQRAGVPPAQAIAVTLLIGWLKEVLDGQVDGGDLAADAAGSLAAAFLRLEVPW
ncbi:MAG: hypothetical protein VKQ33_05705 [Candidatus Sericytochromatia bacterium]|nr:hypothetical protein [Candidatus Sericytochromatia bacterium]